MTFIPDANILLRGVQVTHRQHWEATESVRQLRRRGYTAFVVPQAYYEFWVVATRPVPQNGLGKTPAEAGADLTRLKRTFTLLGDTPAVFDEWERLVVAHAVSGKPAHDARLVAAMNVQGGQNDPDVQRPGLPALPEHHRADPGGGPRVAARERRAGRYTHSTLTRGVSPAE